MINKGIVLVSDYVHDLLIEGLKAADYDVIYNPDFYYEDLGEILPRLQGIVINSKIKMTKEMIDLNPNLNFIARLGSGLEIIDVNYAKENGIRVINSPAGNANAVGEHALGMLLALANNLCISNKEVKAFKWNRELNRGWELEGKTIGIVGVGHTGTAFAQKLMGWNVNVLGYDKYKSQYTKEMPHVKETNLEEIQQKADIISFHLPLTPETRHLVDFDFINQCKDGVVLINTSRGNVIKTSALVEGLKSGKVYGACLDVFENEKPNNYCEKERQIYSELFSFKNVLVSPHIAGWTHESLQKIATIILDKILEN
jgi:D-3-phosphoglycerate dehydrogenase